MHTCPHCDRPGVGFFAKMLSSSRYPAVCRFCGGSSYKCPSVLKIQLAIAIAFLATVPNLASGETAKILGTVTAILVVAVGQIGPLCKGI